MGYDGDKLHLEAERGPWDGGMSHDVPDAAELFGKGSCDLGSLSPDSPLARLSGSLETDEERAAIGRLLLSDFGPSEEACGDADDASRAATLIVEGRAKAKTGRGALAGALKKYALPSTPRDLELVDEAQRDAGTQTYAQAKHAAAVPVRFAKNQGRRITSRPSSRRRDRAVARRSRKLMRFKDKDRMRRATKSWGRKKWYQGYSKLRGRRLEKRLKKASAMLKPSRLRFFFWIVSSASVFALSALLAVGGIGLLGGLAASSKGGDGGESLSASERQVYLFLKDKGLDDVHAAAVMGNIRAESGGACGDEFDTGAVEASGGGGHGLCQWTGGRFDGPGGLKEYAEGQGKPWTDISVQLGFFWTEYSEPWSGAYSILDGDDPAGGTYVHGSKDGFEGTSEIPEATRQFCYGWERAGIPHESVRIKNAQWYYQSFSGSVGTGKQAQVLATALKVADTATPYVFGGTDIVEGCDCSYFTQYCYASAGISIPRQSEDQMRAGKKVPVHEARPGDLLWCYGHVGIYVDAGHAVEQTPPEARITPLSYEPWQYAIQFD